MSKRLVIIDGKSVFYRGYYAMPSLSTADGTPTGGVYGFAVMALEVIKKLHPDYVCVAWDKPKTNIRLRRELYPQYKANRKPAPPDFYEQIPLLQELLAALGWPLYELDDYEADDLMGAFAEQARHKGIESFLITSDLDVLQLINSHVHIYTLKKGFSNIELFNAASFREKYGIDPNQWVDVKALKGDASDNIPGVAGIGEKTAIELIQRFGSLEGVYEHLPDIKPALRSKLEKDETMARLSKRLVTLMVDAPVQLDLSKAALGGEVKPELITVLKKLEFRTLLRQVEESMSYQARHQVEVEESGVTREPAQEVTFQETAPQDMLLAVALAPEGTELWVSSGPKMFARVSLLSGDSTALEQITHASIVGHDLKRILRALLAYDRVWHGKVEHDTRIAAFLLNSLERQRELSDVVGEPIDMSRPGEVIAAIWQAYSTQTEQLSHLDKLQKLAHEVDFPIIYLLAKMEHRGIKLDSSYLRTMSQELDVGLREFEQQIYEMAGEKFNINSPSQLSAILFEKLKLPTIGGKKGKNGYSTDAKELERLRRTHPIIQLISNYREYAKLKSTYVDSLPKLVDEQGKLHTTYTLDVAATGRLSSLNPNLQNIPTRTELGQAIRRAFVPEKGHVFVNADYSQFELRLAAVFANDKEMIDDFNNDRDIHAATAARIYGVPLEQVTKDQRRNAKVINFGILYGMSPHGLSVATGMNVKEAGEFITKYFELHPALRQFMDSVIAESLRKGYVETILGRRRPTPDLKSSNFVVREAAKRAAINMPAQGTEADLMKMAMLQVEEKLGGLGSQLLQIHDSILVECPEENAAAVSDVLRSAMENVYKLPVALKVEVRAGHDWSQL